MRSIVTLPTSTQEQEKEKKDLTTFILEKDQNHFQVGKPIHKMGMRASPTGELIFEMTLKFQLKIELVKRVTASIT